MRAFSQEGKFAAILLRTGECRLELPGAFHQHDATLLYELTGNSDCSPVPPAADNSAPIYRTVAGALDVLVGGGAGTFVINVTATGLIFPVLNPEIRNASRFSGVSVRGNSVY